MMEALSDIFTTVLMTILLIFLALPIVVIVFGFPLIDLIDFISSRKMKADFDSIRTRLAECDARWKEVKRRRVAGNAELKRRIRAEKQRQREFRRDCARSGYPGAGYRRTP
jgi:hypothetical protein